MEATTLNETFEANDAVWKTDGETLNLLRQFRTAKNEEMVAFMFHAGRAAGRIVPA